MSVRDIAQSCGGTLTRNSPQRLSQLDESDDYQSVDR